MQEIDAIYFFKQLLLVLLKQNKIDFLIKNSEISIAEYLIMIYQGQYSKSEYVELIHQDDLHKVLWDSILYEKKSNIISSYNPNISGHAIAVHISETATDINLEVIDSNCKFKSMLVSKHNISEDLIKATNELWAQLKEVDTNDEINYHLQVFCPENLKTLIKTPRKDIIFSGSTDQALKFHGSVTYSSTALPNKKTIGEFKHGRRHGFVKTYNSDTSSYEGEYYEDRKHGKGFFISKNNNKYEEIWEHGKRISQIEIASNLQPENIL